MRTRNKDFIAKEGYPFIIGGLASSLLFYKKSNFLSALSFAFGAFSTFFFRNPPRNIPIMKHALVSPADGVVISKEDAYERYFFKEKVRRISIFMSLFDVHVNRSPINGTVLNVVYNKGKYLPAYREKASMDNEQNAFLIEGRSGRKIVVVQIAGIIARRIVSYKKPVDEVEKGEIIGLIRFGSRLDVYIRDDIHEFVNVNEKVKAGETILGVFK